jgi:hypothetical protein
MRGVRDRVEHADYQCAAAVGLDNLDLETLAGVSEYGRKCAMPPTLSPISPGI